MTKEPKILFAPPYRLLFKEGEDAIGALREDLIGGKGRGHARFKGVVNKKKIILTRPGRLDETRRPLFLAGRVDSWPKERAFSTLEL